MFSQRDSLWAEFQASVAAQPGPSKQKDAPKMVKVRVTYKFAGEEIKSVEIRLMDHIALTLVSLAR